MTARGRVMEPSRQRDGIYKIDDGIHDPEAQPIFAERDPFGRPVASIPDDRWQELVGELDRRLQEESNGSTQG